MISYFKKNAFKYYTGRIRHFATVIIEQGALIIGGWVDSIQLRVPTVACYKSEWNKLDDLQSSRRMHSAIINGDKIYIIGGLGEQ